MRHVLEPHDWDFKKYICITLLERDDVARIQVCLYLRTESFGFNDAPVTCEPLHGRICLSWHSTLQLCTIIQPDKGEDGLVPRTTQSFLDTSKLVTNYQETDKVSTLRELLLLLQFPREITTQHKTCPQRGDHNPSGQEPKGAIIMRDNMVGISVSDIGLQPPQGVHYQRVTKVVVHIEPKL
ncbi:hypothetical protein BDR22DRAFT_822006 [Usnea florida]